VFAARRLVEPGIVAAAVERKTPSGIARLKAHLANERRHMSERGPRARRAEIKASGELHLLIAAMSGNVVLLRFMEELVARSSLVIALYGKSGASSCGHDEHAAVVEALKSGDAEAAQALMLRHIGHIEADLELRAGATLALKDALEL
jgi:DNA-binding GntR family transcriptional regulator